MVQVVESCFANRSPEFKPQTHQKQTSKKNLIFKFQAYIELGNF
jgi:hypothetical protein